MRRKLSPPCAGFPQQLSPVQGEVGVRTPSARGAPSDSWARGCGAGDWEGGGGELTAICCCSHCESGYFEVVCVCACVGGRQRGKGREFYWVCLAQTGRGTAVLSAPAPRSATRPEKKQPSVHQRFISSHRSRRTEASARTRRHLWLLCLFFHSPLSKQ